MKRLFICTGFSILIFVASILKAGDIATESTQSATMGIIALLQQVTNEIMEIVEDIEELEATAGRLINQMSTALTDQIPLVGDIFDLLEDLEAVIEAGSGLAYSANNLETFMQDRFKSYDDYLTSIRADGGIDRANFETRFREWNNGHRDAIQSIMKAHGLHSDQLATEEDRLTKLENLSRNSEGRMQAAQIGHQIAIEEVKQMHKLRELLMEQSNLHASYFATKQAMDAETQAVTEYITEITQVVPITDGAGY